MKKSRVFSFSVLMILSFSLLITACSTTSCPPTGSESCDPQLPQVTTDTGWWIDETHSVSPAIMQELNAESEAINRDGFQLAGLIVSNSQSDPSKVASDFGNKSGVGYGSKDNGVVVLVLLDKKGDDGNKPYIFLARGEGQSYLTAGRLNQVITTVFAPQRAKGQWQQGLVDVTKTIHTAMLDPKAAAYLDEGGTTSGIPTTGWIIIIVVVLILVVLDFAFDQGNIVIFFIRLAPIIINALLGGGGKFSGGGDGG